MLPGVMIEMLMSPQNDERKEKKKICQNIIKPFHLMVLAVFLSGTHTAQWVATGEWGIALIGN